MEERLMGNFHVKDNFLDKVYKYEKISELNLLIISEWKRYSVDEIELNPRLKDYILLKNGTKLTQPDGLEVWVDNNRIVYAPVYDCSRCEDFDSLCEEDDLIGFVCLDYDFEDYIET
jgi:hypothetical protein